MKGYARLLLLVWAALFLSGCTYRTAKYRTATDQSVPDTQALFDARISRPVLPDDTPCDKPICTAYADRGLLRVQYASEDKLKLQVSCGSDAVVYNLLGDGSVQSFSLQFGSGDYTVRILRNTHETRYAVLEAESFSVTLEDENAVFLHAIQNVCWHYDQTPIIDVPRIIAPALIEADDAQLDSACAKLIYQYIVQSISYDGIKAGLIDHDYLPDIEQVYTQRKGICYDYAALLAAMLRSIGIPAKLAKGYMRNRAGDYHAWVEAYIDGEWITIDATADALLGDGTVMQKNAADYLTVCVY